MVKGKRNSVTVVISSSDDDELNDSLLKNKRRVSKSAPAKRNPKKARVSLSNSCSRSLQRSDSYGFDQVKRFCEEFDQGFTQFKVSSGSVGNNDLWVDKYTPSSLEELAVHKKKVEEVKMWFEERLKSSWDTSSNNLLLISGQAGVGKSATIYAVASHLGAQVCEWNTPTPTIWQEHMHNSNSGLKYISKLDEFGSFVERMGKYGSVSSSSSQPIILLIDDLPLVNNKSTYGKLYSCLHLLLRSVRIPTAILINEYGKSGQAEQHARYWEELQLSLQNAGASKVAFNPITVNSIRRLLSKISRAEQFEVSDEQMDIIAKTSGGDVRQAITSFQYFSLKPHSVSITKRISTQPQEKDQLDDGVPLSFGKDATLSLFHALGKFLHNKRETGSSIISDIDAIVLKEKYVRHPLKMDSPELVLSQAHGQARLVADFLHENVLDFVGEDSVKDAWGVASYLSDSDLLLAPLNRNFEDENVIQSAAASVAVRGVLFGNACPVSSRWHAIRRPKLWQVEQSIWKNKHGLLSERQNWVQSGIHFNHLNPAVIATELKPSLNWIGFRIQEENNASELDKEDDEIEDW